MVTCPRIHLHFDGLVDGLVDWLIVQRVIKCSLDCLISCSAVDEELAK